MQQEHIDKIRDEMKRLSESLDKLESRLITNYYKGTPCKERAAVKRASLDLKRVLTENVNASVW